MIICEVSPDSSCWAWKEGQSSAVYGSGKAYNVFSDYDLSLMLLRAVAVAAVNLKSLRKSGSNGAHGDNIP